MIKIKERFEILSEKYPNLSSYSIFAKIIRGNKIDIKTIEKWFKKLVSKEDYIKKDRDMIIRHLFNLSFLSH